MTDDDKALVERLRTKYCCSDWADDCNCDEAADRIEAQAAEIERLREACVNYDLALLLAFPNGASGEVFVHWNDARAALGETE